MSRKGMCMVAAAVAHYSAPWARGVSYGSSPGQAPAAPPLSLDGFANVTISALALVLLVGVGLYLLKNGAFFRKQGSGERKLHVRETRMLGSRQFLVVVEYENSKLLLGVTPGKIDYLCPLEAGPRVAESFGAVLERTGHTTVEPERPQ